MYRKFISKTLTRYFAKEIVVLIEVRVDKIDPE